MSGTHQALPNEDPTPTTLPKLKPEHWGLGAVIFSLVTGGAGVGLHVSSNKEIVQKLEELNTTMVRFEESSKAANDRNMKLEAKVDKQQDVIDHLKDEEARLHEAIHVLEEKVKK